MTAVIRPRGPLPARVYWTRRLLLLAVALGLVFAVTRLVGGGGPDSGPAAQPVGAEPSSSSSAPVPPSSSTPQLSPGRGATATPSGRGGTGLAAPLARPTGRCQNSDVVAVPSITGPAYAARPVVLTLVLTTRTSPACTWDVSAASLVLKITSGPDRIWSTQDCPTAVPRQAVVVRRDAPATVPVVWSGLRSDADCSRSTSWVRQGWYHAVAAAFGAEPRDIQFRLGLAPQVTRTAAPTPSASPTGSPTVTPGPAARTPVRPADPTSSPAATPATSATPGAARR